MNRNKKVVARMTVTSAVLVMTTITALGGSTEDGKGNVTGSVTPGKKGMAGVIAELQDAEVPSYNAQAEGTKNKQNGTVSLGGGEIENAGISAGIAKLAGLAAEEVVRSRRKRSGIYCSRKPASPGGWAGNGSGRGTKSSGCPGSGSRRG